MLSWITQQLELSRMQTNYVFAWTDTMKNEIKKLSDIDGNKIYTNRKQLNLIIIFQI